MPTSSGGRNAPGCGMRMRGGCGQPPSMAPLAFSAYGAAVDREECASHAYANFMKRIATTLSAESADPPGCEPDDRAKRRRVELTIPERAPRPASSSGSLGWHPLAWGGRIALVVLFVFASISITAQA